MGADWTVAAAVTAALLATYGLVRAGVSAWWLTPVVAVAATAFSLRRATRRERRQTEQQ
jgi:Flp pilus assembly protein TadB